LTSAERGQYLEIIQSVVARMANNSFILRGWSVTVVVALLAVSARETQVLFAVLALLPTLSFWWLDAYYLRQERLFRALYDHVRTASAATLAADPYSLSTANVTDPGTMSMLVRPVVVGLHGPLLIAVLTVINLLW
jgi:hypothetical protein